LYVEIVRVRSRFLAAAPLLVVLPAGAASAQLCVGNTGFELTNIQPAANIEIDHHAQRYSLEARLHFHHALAAIEYGFKTWEKTTWDGQSHALVLSVGLNPVSPKSRVSVCPLLRWTRLSGPNQIDGTSWNFSEHSLAASVNVGFLMARRQLWDFMPTLAVTFGTGDPTLMTEFGQTQPEYQDFCCGRRSFTTFRFGFGLGYSDDLTLIPAITWPLGDGGGAQKTYSIRAVIRVL
jgi:hypothetical protein